MWYSHSDEKGISLVEVCIALFLLAIGVLGLIALQPSAWRQSGRSDYLGRAAGLLAQDLQVMEALIMNPNNSLNVDPGSKDLIFVTPTETVLPSGQTTQKTGDIPFTLHRTGKELSGGAAYRITVQVTWPGNPTGIRESMIVTRQEYYRQ